MGLFSRRSSPGAGAEKGPHRLRLRPGVAGAWDDFVSAIKSLSCQPPLYGDKVAR